MIFQSPAGIASLMEEREFCAETVAVLHTASAMPMTPDATRRNGSVLAWLSLLAILLFAILLSAPPRLGQNNEERMSEYVTDVVTHGNWICQKDAVGDVTSKPPMFCWISSAATLLVGEINRFTLYLPSALSVLLLSWIIYFCAKRYFGPRAGFLGGSIYLLSNVAVNELTTSRFDALFALFVTLGAIAAFQAWKSGRGWVWFWLAAAGSTLTKGPLGLILSAAGLLAIFFQKREEKTPLRGSHLSGVGLFLLIAGGWFALAYWKIGPALIDKMIFKELIGHAAGEAKSDIGFHKPSLWFLTDFGPWSLLTVFAFWRIWKKPSLDPDARRFEGFVACWFLLGLVLFSLGGHERSRLIYPVVPAAALLAGNELARLTAFFSFRRLRWVVGFSAILMLAVVAFYYHVQRPKKSAVKEDIALRELAKTLQKKFGKTVEIKSVDAPFPLRFYLKDFGPTISPEDAARWLKEKPGALVAVSNSEKLTEKLGQDAALVSIVARWPVTGQPRVEILGHR